MQNKALHTAAFLLLVAGGLNWLLVGVISFDLVAWIFTDMLGMDILTRVVYVLVGVAAVYELLVRKGDNSAAPSAGGGMPAGDVTHG